MKKLIAFALLLSSLSFGASPPNTVSILTFGADPTGVADISSALNGAISSGAKTIIFPNGKYLLNGTATIPLANVLIDCQGAPAAYNQPPTYGSTGVTFLLTSTSVQPFTITEGVRIHNCNFFWPNQTGATSTPISYPPLFTEVVGHQLSSFECVGCRVINAYDFLDQASSSDAFGDIKLTDTMGYAIRYWFQLAQVSEWVTITNFHGDFGLYQNVANTGPNYYLANWTAANGAFMHVFGNGNGSTVGSSVTVGGFIFSGGVYAYNKFLWVDNTGSVSEAKFNAIYDAIPHVMQVDSGGCAADIEMDGAYYSYLATFPSPGPGGADNATAITIGASPSSICGSSNIRITGHLFSTQGDFIDVVGSGIKGVFVGVSGTGTYGSSSTAGTYYFAQVNGATAIVDFYGNHVEPKTSGPTQKGFNLVNCYTCTVNGNSFNGVYNAIILGSSSVSVSGAGNVSLGTPTGGTPISGTGDYAHQLLTGNVWDHYALPTVSACGAGPSGVIGNGHSNDLSGVVTVGGGAVTSCTINFANLWGSAPRCYAAGPPSATFPLVPAASTSALVITSAASMGGNTLFYHCDGGW